ncbi:GNAT family N-acetyltransferase [Streptomyces alfalfae]|uniref:GNAT family N-acetyltransferase n=1 Tax=Streptomyces alfalfae TaxID=1642299 RepID=A0A7T4PEU6_9ACTN|nr:GNAT family N-acetyltransferase [Streptomyces alfalfae]QQC88947.1 GNAT family N-acetyltransferase [Streptomyces alfalfae]
MPTDVTVRPARPADAPALAALRRAFQHEDDEGRRPSTPARPLEEAEQWTHDRLGGDRWSAWVAEAGGEICGHVFLCPVERMPDPYGGSAPIGYVTNFYVTPSQRRRGVGARLLKTLREHYRDAGFETLIAWPSERSSPLWRRAGFQPPDELLELPLDP